MVVEPLVVQEVHGIIHGSSNMEDRGDDMVSMRFESVQVNLGGRQMVENVNKTLDGLILLV